MLTGTLFGVTFAPVLYIMDHTKGASHEGLDYVFSHYTGIYLSGTTYFIIYCAIKKNQPDVYPKVILPGFISGCMWAVAQTAWFVANQVLSESISFPIITSGPCIVAALIGILIYKEIQGWKNYVVLFLVFCLAISGSLLVAFSSLA
jgi:glucose uptake protein GlcU